MDWVRGTDSLVTDEELAEAIKKENSDAAEAESKKRTMIRREMLTRLLVESNWYFLPGQLLGLS